MRLVLTISMLLAMTPLYASTPDDPVPGTAAPRTSGNILETIVVSATRTERVLFTTPAALSIIDAQSINLIQPFGYQDLFESVPSVNVVGGPRRIAEEPSIRGFSDEQVVLRIDGTRLNYNKAHGGRFLLDPSLLKSVEVLRGAGSSLYGSGALGGAFVLESASGRDLAKRDAPAGVRLTTGFQSNGEEWRLGATGYAAGARHDVLAHLSGRSLGENLIDGSGNDILATRDESVASLLKLGFTPEQQRLELAFESFDNDGRNPTNANEVATPDNLVDRTTERRNHRLRYQLAPDDRPWLDLSLTAYENNVTTREFRLDDARLDLSDFRTRGAELVNTATVPLPFADAVRLTGGLELYEDRQSGRRNGAARPQFPDAKVEYQAAFLQAEVPLPGGFAVIPGIRFDAFDYRADRSFADRDDQELTSRLSISWQPITSLYLWAEYAEAFRAPSLGELFADGVHFIVPLAPGQVVVNEFVATPELRAEQSEQVQMGARWQQENVFQREFTLSVETTVWQSDVADYVDQVVIFIDGPPQFDRFTETLVFPGSTTNRNVDAELQGAELSADISHRLGYVSAGLTLIDGERRNGEDLASVQPNRATLGAGVYLLEGQLTLAANLVLSDGRRDVPSGALQTAGYGTADFYVQYRPRQGMLKDWEFNLALDNAFDNSYRVHPNAIAQPGRSLRLSLSRNFGWGG
jgi:hemoglobin/transferrin/lactoferrin receptor protein